MNNNKSHELDMQSKNITNEHIAKISELFPNCIVEGKIDFEMLKQELSEDIIKESKEKYQLTWPGKSKAILIANSQTNNTLIPVKEKSVDFKNTKNVYIEGDNLEALKILQESYLNKVKLIYIDPPYNTGNDFIYNDKFAKSTNEELQMSGQYDDHNNRLISNSESNGRFHSDWLSMMYPRLKLARNLLKEDGVIFISIDDNEQANLKKICDEIFGTENNIGTIIWERAFSPKNDAKFFSLSHDYILVYSKNIDKFEIGLLPRTAEANSRYKNPDNDPKGPWTADNMTVKTYSPAYDYPIITPTGKEIHPTNGRCWFTNKERMEELIKSGKVYFGESGENMPRIKRYLCDVQQGMTPTTLWKYTEVGHNQEARQELKKLFNNKGYFDGPKPTRLINRIVEIANVKDNDIVLDFFSGSATTAHSIMQLNAKDHINRKYIMVQLPERTLEKTEAYIDGYKTICDIGEERIRRAGKKIKEETNADIDYGFRVYKVDSSNMKDIYYTPTELKQSQLNMFESNVKEDRTPEDLLTQVILDLGLTLDLSIEEKRILNNNVYFVESNSLVACFDNIIDINIIDEICKCKPLKIVFKESSFKTDSDKINTFERIKKLSSDTEVNVI